MHAIVLLIFHFFSRLSADASFMEYAKELITYRWETAAYLLPERNFSREKSPDKPSLPNPLPQELILNSQRIGIADDFTYKISKPRNKFVTHIDRDEPQPSIYPGMIHPKPSIDTDDINFTDIRTAMDPSAFTPTSSQRSGVSNDVKFITPNRNNYGASESITFEDLMSTSDNHSDLRAFIQNV